MIKSQVYMFFFFHVSNDSCVTKYTVMELRILNLFQSLGVTHWLSSDDLSRVMRKHPFCISKTKAQISCMKTAQLISAYVFTTYIGPSLNFIYPKFQAFFYGCAARCVWDIVGNTKDMFSHDVVHLISQEAEWICFWYCWVLLLFYLMWH